MAAPLSLHGYKKRLNKDKHSSPVLEEQCLFGCLGSNITSFVFHQHVLHIVPGVKHIVPEVVAAALMVAQQFCLVWRPKHRSEPVLYSRLLWQLSNRVVPVTSVVVRFGHL